MRWFTHFDVVVVFDAGQRGEENSREQAEGHNGPERTVGIGSPAEPGDNRGYGHRGTEAESPHAGVIHNPFPLAATRPPQLSPRSRRPPATNGEDDGKQGEESPARHGDMFKVSPVTVNAAFRQ